MPMDEYMAWCANNPQYLWSPISMAEAEKLGHPGGLRKLETFRGRKAARQCFRAARDLRAQGKDAWNVRRKKRFHELYEVKPYDGYKKANASSPRKIRRVKVRGRK